MIAQSKSNCKFQQRLIHKSLHNKNYSSDYDPTLNADSNYTFGGKRARQESVYKPNYRRGSQRRNLLSDTSDTDNDVSISEDSRESENEFRNESESVQDYIDRIDKLCYPMVDIFKNHPHFNTANEDYQRRSNQHLLNMADIGINQVTEP